MNVTCFGSTLRLRSASAARPMGTRARLSSSVNASSSEIRSPESALSRTSATLIGQPSAYERVEGVWGNREVPPLGRRRGLVGKTWFPPRERAGGARRSRRDRLRNHEAELGYGVELAD